MERNGTTADIELSVLKKGDIAIIRPGEKIPVDGVVTEGNSFVNESMLTEESVPVKKEKGEPVIGGATNGDGAIRIKITGSLCSLDGAFPLLLNYIKIFL